MQQNINSSKALSALSRQDRHHVNGADPPAIGSKWVAAGIYHICLLNFLFINFLGASRAGSGSATSFGGKPMTTNRWNVLSSSGNGTESMKIIVKLMENVSEISVMIISLTVEKN